MKALSEMDYHYQSGSNGSYWILYRDQNKDSRSCSWRRTACDLKSTFLVIPFICSSLLYHFLSCHSKMGQNAMAVYVLKLGAPGSDSLRHAAGVFRGLRVLCSILVSALHRTDPCVPSGPAAVQLFILKTYLIYMMTASCSGRLLWSAPWSTNHLALVLCDAFFSQMFF